MKKIISLFQRNYDTDHLVRNEVVPGAEWVLAGEGHPTVKLDGTCCKIKGGKLFKRYDAKAFTVDRKTGERHEWKRKPPEGFIPAQDPDPITGHWPGWLAVSEDKPEDKWHREAFFNSNDRLFDGTYELIGPKISGNPEQVPKHMLIHHGERINDVIPRTFDGIREWLSNPENDVKGIVFHHPDGRMVKIKKSDFGFKRETS